MRAFRIQRPAVIVSALLVILAAVLVVTLPPAPQHVAARDPALAARTIGGAFHVHTNRSDGSGDKAAVARAARGAGLQFVIITDHGDGMRRADPPEYVEGVLCLDGVEISTDGGHYIALAAAPAPYPLGGGSAAVVEDVARLGGFGIAAHPASARPELAWGDWSQPVDGLEWINADSEWRDEGRWQLARALAGYPLRPAAALAALLDRPVSALDGWDSVASRRRVLAIAGHDAHGGVGRRIEDPAARRTIGVPSYEASFRVFSTRVELDRPLTRDADADGRALVEALRAGRFYTQIDAIAGGATLEFTGRTAEESVRQGSLLRGSGTASFSVRAAVPEGATIVAYRNGSPVAQGEGRALDFQASEVGAYRVEVQAKRAPGSPPVPWLVSNPIFRLADVPPPSMPVWSAVLQLPTSEWRIEKEDGSDGALQVGDGGEVDFTYRLREAPRASQFVALATDIPFSPPEYDAVQFVARSIEPRRVSIQLRFARDGDARWRRSVYLDSTARPVTVEVSDLRRADGPIDRPDVRRATSLLFVIDLTNARPGDKGAMTLKEVRLVRRTPVY